MDEFETPQNDGFVLLPAASGGGALVRRSQIAGARANGRDGAIVYAKTNLPLYAGDMRAVDLHHRYCVAARSISRRGDSRNPPRLNSANPNLCAGGETHRHKSYV